MTKNTTSAKKRQPKQKSYNKLLADLEKAKEKIAAATGDANMTIDITKLDAAVQKVTPEIAAAVGLPPHLLRVTAEILTPLPEQEVA